MRKLPVEFTAFAYSIMLLHIGFAFVNRLETNSVKWNENLYEHERNGISSRVSLNNFLKIHQNSLLTGDLVDRKLCFVYVKKQKAALISHKRRLYE